MEPSSSHQSETCCIHKIIPNTSVKHRKLTLRIKCHCEEIRNHWKRTFVLITDVTVQRSLCMIQDTTMKDLREIELPITVPAGFSMDHKNYIWSVFGIGHKHNNVVSTAFMQIGAAEYVDVDLRNRLNSVCKMKDISVKITHSLPSFYTVMDLNYTSEQSTHFIFLIETKSESCHIFLHSSKATTFRFPFELQSTREYTVFVFRGDAVILGDTKAFVIDAGGFQSFQAYMTQSEVCELYIKACDFLRQRATYDVDGMQTDCALISHLYRNKTRDYFERIRRKGGLMRKYVKNVGGDQASTLNGNLHGLFFSAHLDRRTFQPPDFSYFGEQRLHIPIPFLINNYTNMYFADFYCHHNNHHVTLVLTQKGTDEDEFCKKRLHRLNPFFNPFLYRPAFQLWGNVNISVSVEVFYTENINISELIWRSGGDVYFSFVNQKGNPHNRTLGRPKNKECTICNL